jgi:hypothetical protein
MLKKLLPVLLLVGCSTTKDVMTLSDGKNRYVARSENRIWTESIAIQTANEFCEETKKRAHVSLQPKAVYIGESDEQLCQVVDRASDTAVVLGGNDGWKAGRVGKAVTGPCLYEAEIVFECK